MEFARLIENEAPAFQLSLSSSVIASCESYYALLQRWNTAVNLMADLDPLEVARFHFLESMYAVHFISPSTRNHIDLGSGAGFPAIPLKLLLPTLRNFLYESRSRRCAFLKELIRELKLSNVSIIPINISSVSIRKLHMPFDIITFRAIQFDSKLLNALVSVMPVEGRLLVWHGQASPHRDYLLHDPRLVEIEKRRIPTSRARFISIFERDAIAKK
ncbi:MAG: 16S rRNA (guanine(527)-N(7))-methyltransferase RsmG [Acidobacteria bacterium]|nr:16S rRNA (guanine(527)-N(7))-methyltransferase RsmG [Acidobacteriota bacterium]MBI3655344.1 16S rRNA (guanine(527)-N(7))-methyltransferase RsmG [Acidobacteriota bacterium]